MGATPMQILLHVMLPESVPSLINNFTLAIAMLVAMASSVLWVGLFK